MNRGAVILATHPFDEVRILCEAARRVCYRDAA